MHECITESAFLANAEVDSMRGVIDGGVDAGIKISTSRVEIEKVQEEIRLELDCREERLRELEFLEKGGDPLDFNFSHTVSVSVQSTSLTDQHLEQIVTSQAKDCCASTALRLRHGETVENFGKPEDTNCEANSGDNLLLFDGENKLIKDKNSKSRGTKNTVVPSEFLTRGGGADKASVAENSAIFRPYARRNRSKSCRDGARSASMDVAHPHNKQASPHLRPVTRDVKGSLSEANGKDQTLSSICKLKSSDRFSDGVLHNIDSIHCVEAVGLPTEDKLTNALHSGKKERAIYAQTNGDLFGSGKDHEEPRDSTVCSAGIEAEEGIALTNPVALLSDATTPQHNGVACQTDGLDSSEKIICTQKQGDKCADRVNDEFNEKFREPVLLSGEDNKPVTQDPVEIKTSPKPVGPGSFFIGDDGTDHDNRSCSTVKVEGDEDLEKRSMIPEMAGVFENQHNMIDRNCNSLKFEMAGAQNFTKASLDKVSGSVPSRKDAIANDNNLPDPKACNKQLADKMVEESVLAEAKIIQAKRKRMAELSMRSLPLENCEKSHWDFLLEEVAWLANDFIQERLWKMNAAAQISRKTALSSHLRDQKQMPVRRMKFVARSMAKAVMEFWHTSELLVNDSSNSTREIVAPGGSSLLEPQSPCNSLALKSYALRFLRFNSSTVPSFEAEEPATLNSMHDLGMQETSGESCITEDDLFYAIPPGAMECYKTSIESFVSQCEKNCSLQKADDATKYDANDGEEIVKENGYDEDEGESSTQYLPGTVEWSKASKFPHKKQKGAQKPALMVKRPASQNVVSIPTKRMRTASRQRVLGSSIGVDAVNMLAMNKADTSSGDTNPYQDDQRSLHGGSQIQRSLEMESSADFGKFFPVDSGEISTKHKKKKKAKDMNSSYEQRSLRESAILDDIGGHSKRRLDSHHLDSNGSNGLFGQHRNKKLKVLMLKSENVLDYGAPTTGSMPSPAASQMSNMPNATEYKKLIANRDRLRQAKVTKLPIPVSGSGSDWTSFEEQALVVLVHDMGPNWELVSDALNSTLLLKRIYRGPKECKEKHKALMDQTAGDGADSADDSGSSQPYPSTMPGIPKGSARQLFQRLHAPMEQDTVKSHFEKIIMIEQKQHHRRTQYDSHDQKHITPHNSHMIAVSQVSPNNLDGGFLTPLDHIDAMMSSPDALALGYQSPQSNGFANQSSLPSVLPPSGANSIYQGSVGTAVGNSIASPSGPLSHRNGRYSVSRPSMATDDKQRIQRLNPMFSGGNIQQSTMPVSGSHPLADQLGARRLQGGNVIGMVNGFNSRGMPMSRPGFQGLSSPTTLDSAAVLSPGMVGRPSLEMQSAIGSSQVNSMQRPMDNSHQIRPGQSLEHHRQMMVPELQMRSSQAISGSNAIYTSQAGLSSAQTYSVHPQQKNQMSLQQSHDVINPHHAHLRAPNNAIGSQHSAYARLVKERQLQQQMLQHQQQFSASNSMTSQAQRHLPVTMQNAPQVQPQSSLAVSHSSPSPSSPMTPIHSQLQQTHHLPPHGLIRDSQTGASNLPSQVIKQRQRHPQHQQQPVRLDTAHQRQQLQSQQHGKQLKEEGTMNQNVTVDQYNLNGQSHSLVGQSADKIDQELQIHGSQNST
ncbi:unnamed protein product [Rhodiola kirilowii]